MRHLTLGLKLFFPDNIHGLHWLIHFHAVDHFGVRGRLNGVSLFVLHFTHLLCVKPFLGACHHHLYSFSCVYLITLLDNGDMGFGVVGLDHACKIVQTGIAAGTIILVIGCGLVFKKASGIVPVADLAKLLEVFGIDAFLLGVVVVIINGLAVSLDNGSHVIDAFHAALDFQTVNACVYELWDMVDKAEVLGIKDKGAGFVFLYAKVLVWSCLLNEVVFPAAGVGAVALVGVAAGHVVTQQAAP